MDEKYETTSTSRQFSNLATSQFILGKYFHLCTWQLSVQFGECSCWQLDNTARKLDFLMSAIISYYILETFSQQMYGCLHWPEYNNLYAEKTKIICCRGRIRIICNWTWKRKHFRLNLLCDLKVSMSMVYRMNLKKTVTANDLSLL